MYAFIEQEVSLPDFTFHRYSPPSLSTFSDTTFDIIRKCHHTRHYNGNCLRRWRGKKRKYRPHKTTHTKEEDGCKEELKNERMDVRSGFGMSNLKGRKVFADVASS